MPLESVGKQVARWSCCWQKRCCQSCPHAGAGIATNIRRKSWGLCAVAESDAVENTLYMQDMVCADRQMHHGSLRFCPWQFHESSGFAFPTPAGWPRCAAVVRRKARGARAGARSTASTLVTFVVHAVAESGNQCALHCKQQMGPQSGGKWAYQTLSMQLRPGMCMCPQLDCLGMVQIKEQKVPHPDQVGSCGCRHKTQAI